MNANELISTARALVAPGKGVLAADESSGTIKKRLDTISVESTEENRRAYRDLLFTAPGVESFISGVILFDETIRQSTREREPFPQVLADRGIIPGIKVDKSTVPLPGSPQEKLTQGLDGLGPRLEEYYDMGARFTKWRAVITIGDGIPTQYCIDANAQLLALFAAYSQQAGLVPIVEPEVLMDGDHSIERCEAVTAATLESVYHYLFQAQVLLEGTLLKPNMVVSGKGHRHQADEEEVAEATVRTLLRAVPAAVPGIVFLSGGQSPEEATANLSAINRLGPLPWELSFSYGRALQEYSLKAWRGDQANVSQAQQILAQRARFNSLARTGKYTPDMETAR
ncbi:MAG TPA: class I fructose-bisphosphate aldolase [Anaerolineae bacterium]|nr:class I fructose-bisphosphate aldolase [Anaerolineae bacterium]